MFFGYCPVKKYLNVTGHRQQGRIQDFKLWGAVKKIASSGVWRENIWGISCEKSRFYANIFFSPILGGAPGAPPWIRPCTCTNISAGFTYRLGRLRPSASKSSGPSNKVYDIFNISCTCCYNPPCSCNFISE